MKTTIFERLLQQVSLLSPRQRERVIEALSQGSAQSEAVGCIERSFESAPRCPHCKHDRIYRHGHANGLQRYRCRECGKTFNATSGTALARLRHKSKWLCLVEQMLASSTVRQATRPQTGRFGDQTRHLARTDLRCGRTRQERSDPRFRDRHGPGQQSPASAAPCTST
jgi:transposase-like protein